MAFLRVFLVITFLVIATYTVLTVGHDGWNLVTPLFHDVQSFSWPGQFNLDFLFYLWLSALWVAWRHKFSIGGIGLALLASVGGILFFAPYLIWASFRANGDIAKLLLGEARRVA